MIRHQCYQVTCNPGTWDDALTACQLQGARLGRITDSVVNDWVAQQNGGRIWISATYVMAEGTWLDADGNCLMLANWAQVQPNNLSNNQDCGTLNFNARGFWDDRPCTDIFPCYVCETR